MKCAECPYRAMSIELAEVEEPGFNMFAHAWFNLGFPEGGCALKNACPRRGKEGKA